MHTKNTFVAIGSLGGTISMTPSVTGGVIPTIDAAELASTVSGLDGKVVLRTTALFRLPGSSLDIDQVLASLEWANHQILEGACGVILTQGTDTIEEVSFLLNLYWRHAEPLIVTGAMRPPQSAGADGPANLLAAIRTAVDPASRNRGVLVLLNDSIHNAQWVRKVDSFAVNAFSSPNGGADGRMIEDSLKYFRSPLLRALVENPARPWPKIALLTCSLGDHGEVSDFAMRCGYEGIVVAGFGAGHVSNHFAQRIEQLTPRIPILIASQTGSGSTASNTYGFDGSETDLVRKGALLAGWLSPQKARLLLGALLASNQKIDQQLLDRWVG
jgi:L-asparaginase